MGVYLKNKPSTVNYIVSSSILQFLLMGVLSIWLIFPNILENLGSQEVGLVELSDDVGDEEIDEVLILLNQEQWIDKLSIKHISQEEAISIMENEIDKEMIGRVREENPFRDIITFSSVDKNNLDSNFELLREKSKSEMDIAGIYNLAETPIQNKSIVSTLSKTISLPLALLIAILGFLFLNSGVQAMVDQNYKMLRSLLLYGSEPHYIKSMFRKALLKETFIGWVVGFILFILVLSQSKTPQRKFLLKPLQVKDQ